MQIFCNFISTRMRFNYHDYYIDKIWNISKEIRVKITNHSEKSIETISHSFSVSVLRFFICFKVMIFFNYC